MAGRFPEGAPIPVLRAIVRCAQAVYAMTKIVSVIAAALFVASMLGVSAAHATVAISTQPTVNMSCSGGVCTPTASDAVLNVGDLANMLASGDTTIKNTSQNPDIEIDAPLSWTSTRRLTLDSYDSITFNEPVQVMGAGALTISTNDGGSGGDFRFLGKGHVKFSDLRSSLIINGNTYALTNHLRGLINLGKFVALAKSIDLHNRVYTTTPIEESGGIIEGLGNTISHLTINVPPTHGAAGALIGENDGVVRDIGILSINITAGDHSGGAGLALVNAGLASIINSYATGQITVGSNGGAGGLVVSSEGSITGCHADVKITSGDNTLVGGLVGNFYGGGFFTPLDQSYATGSVSGGNGASVGGLVGVNTGGALSNSYSTGTVRGKTGAFVGGLIGSNAQISGVGSVSTSYSLGKVTGKQGALVGGLIGDDESSNGIASTYWDLDTSGITNPAQGAGNVPNDPGVTGLSDAQLTSGLPSGFDPTIWAQSTNINNGYPYLIDNAPRK